MNILERTIYDFVKKNPKLKNAIRDSYQFVFSLVPAHQDVINDSLVVRENYFFGFHDKSPWCYGDEYLLANKFSISNRIINKDDTLEVGFFSGPNQTEFNVIGKTTCFNWQQGCMLQWIGKTNEAIFNSTNGKEHISVRVDLQGNIKRTYPYPVAAISPNGQYALSYSFSRLKHHAPGYGYENGNEADAEGNIPQHLGLRIIDLQNGDSKLLFTIADIASINSDFRSENIYHYFTHCLFSPSGNRFVFFHRTIKDNNFVRTRMFSCDLNGKNLFLFPSNGMVSHIGWKSNNEILAYCSTSLFQDSYVLFQDESKVYSLMGEKIFTSDGHPSFSPLNERWLITDTYPDKYRISTLILFDCMKQKRTDIVKLRQPLQFKNELRCDFHPRWNRAGNCISFDSAHKGIRSLCTINLDYIAR